LTTYSKFFGVIAALIIFASWLISNTFVSRLEADTRAMDAVRNEQTLFQQFSSLSSDQRTLIKSSTRIEIRLRELYANLIRHSGSVEMKLNSAIAELKWIDDFQSDVNDLSRSAQRLGELADRIPLQQTTRQDVNSSVEKAKALAKQFQAERDNFKEEERKLIASFKAGTNAMTDEESDSYTSLINSHSEKVEGVLNKYEDINSEILSKYEEIYRQSLGRRRYSAQLANLSGWIAYVFYALGTAIAVYGKWLETKKETKPANAT
jgi:hypothetical protein